MGKIRIRVLWSMEWWPQATYHHDPDYGILLMRSQHR